MIKISYIDKEIIANLFDEYVSHYNASNGMIYLKIIHTKNVANNCENIARSIKILNDDDVKLAWLIGMLHDIGRFEQIKRYSTFRDEHSIDHAEFGVKLLFDEDLLDNFIKLDKESETIIRFAILNHNKLKIDNILTEKQKIFTKIIRDADKLDIFRVCATDKPIDVYGGTKEEIEATIISDDVYKLAMQKKCIPYTMRYTLADDIVCHLMLIWDLNFKRSFDLAKQQGFYKKIQDFDFVDKDSQVKFKKINSLIK